MNDFTASDILGDALCDADECTHDGHCFDVDPGADDRGVKHAHTLDPDVLAGLVARASPLDVDIGPLVGDQAARWAGVQMRPAADTPRSLFASAATTRPPCDPQATGGLLRSWRR